MAFLDDLKLAGLQSFTDALNNPSFRNAITPDLLPTTGDGSIGDNTRSDINAARRGWGALANSSADSFSDQAQTAINGILGLGLPNGPLIPSESLPFQGGQCPGTIYRIKVSETIKFLSSGESRTEITSRGGSITNKIYGPIRGIEFDANQWRLLYSNSNGDPTSGQGATAAPGVEFTSVFIDSITVLSGPDDCGAVPIYGPDNGAPPLNGPFPDFPINPGGNHPGGIRFGSPYLGDDGNMHIPFNVGGDGWALGGSFNPATGEWDFGPPLLVDENGNPIGDPGRNGQPESPNEQQPENPNEDETEPDPIAAKLDAICLRVGAIDDFPAILPNLLTDESESEKSVETIPQLIAYLVEQIDAITGQYPIAIELKDTDPLTPGDQSQIIKLPNQSEALAELFGLAYEANMNSELAVNMLFRLIPEVIAAKNSSLIGQDYSQAIANWAGFRITNKARTVDSNFNPLRSDSIADFLQPSEYKIQGVEDSDPHTLVEWIQQIKYAVAILKASVFRSPNESVNLTEEVQEVGNVSPEDANESWETFIDALNRETSNLTDRTLYPRPRATNVDDVLNPGTLLPDRDGE